MNARSTVEAEHAARRWAVPAAVIAAVLPLLGSVLEPAITGRRIANSLSQAVATYEHAAGIVAVAAVSALGYLALPFALLLLYRAVRARRPEFPAPLRFLFYVGPPLFALSQIVGAIGFVDAVSEWVSTGEQTRQRLVDLSSSGPRVVAAYAGLLGQFAMGAGIVVLSINAMRVGLLPKFVGYVGVFAGIFTVIPIVPSPIVLTFWLLALAFLFAGRWVGKVPPAWETGEAEPWPTLAQMREQAERDKAAGGGGDISRREPDPVPAAAPEAPERPGAARRKRKKRR